MAEPCGVYCVQKKVHQYCPRPRVDGAAVCQQHMNLREGARRRAQEILDQPELRCDSCHRRRREGETRCGLCIGRQQRQERDREWEIQRLATARAAGECGRLLTGRIRYCKKESHEGGECRFHRNLEVARHMRLERWRQLAAAYRVNGGRHAFHNDSQNVHRREITEHTNSLHAELATSAETGVLGEIAEVWKDKKNKSRVLDDMKTWQNLDQVRAPGDWAYRKMLHTVWDKIKASPYKDDLIQRLWEEAKEAVGQCAEGHIGRLGNTLYGYDGDTKAPEISRSEQLQNRMPDIMDIEDDTERKTAAESLLREVGLPEAEWKPWIEAVMA